jgi:hypothetical protein
MKIKLETLRKIIKEEVSKALSEAVSVEQLKSKPVCSSWLKQVMKAGSAASDVAAAWDDMVSAASAGVGSVREESDRIAASYGIDPMAVSFHLRQLLKDPDVKSGACPSGDDFLAAAQSQAAAASAHKPAAAPQKDFDPYERSPQLVGSSGRYVGD